MTDNTLKQLPEAGAQIGRWTVLEEVVQPGKERRWLCRCACGTERTVLDRSLRYGGSVSCGCLRKERAEEVRTPDLTGRQFGDLTVIRKTDSTRHGASRWICQCACGEECIVQGSLLITGRKTRCTGKAHEKNYAYSDITGRRFGRLVAQFPSKRNDRSGSVVWRCRCDCGREIDLPYNTLVYTNQKSCGCQKKEHDQKLRTFLTHVAGTSVDILKSKKVPTDNTSGYKGVYFIRGKYVAKIVFQKKAYYLGAYDKIEEAADARKQAEEILFDGVAKHYALWKNIAERNPVWAEENPVQVSVLQNEDKSISVTFLPELSE